MRYFVTLPVISVVFWLIARATNNERQKKMSKMTLTDFAVFAPKSTLWIGLVCMIFFGGCIILMTLFPNDTATWWVYLTFISFFVMGALVTLYAISSKIIVVKDSIRYTPIFGIKQTFAFSDIKRVKLRKTSLTVYGEKQALFSMELDIIGCSLMIERLKSENIPFDK